jgi:hypothetical protein
VTDMAAATLVYPAMLQQSGWIVYSVDVAYTMACSMEGAALVGSRWRPLARLQQLDCSWGLIRVMQCDIRCVYGAACLFGLCAA